MLILLLTCAMTIAFADSCIFLTNEITIESGPIRGSAHPIVSKYLGIKYAQADRFEKPVNVTPWNDVRDCVSFGPACYQPRFEGPFGISSDDMSEDCLNLNVYVPSTASVQHPLPVMIWIHGGGFFSGSNRLADDSHLAEYGNVILVSINYRLGFFGFLRDSASGFAGNYGLFDQLEAIKWVNRNIGQFGGDPSRITIFGNSAGGMTVGLLSISPLTKGLFKFAIMQSGSYFSQLAYVKPSDGLLENKRSNFNCPGDTDMRSCLQSMEAEDLVQASAGMEIHIMPVVDEDILSESALRNGDFTQESTLMGVARNDGSCITNAIPELSDGPIKLSTGNLNLETFEGAINLTYAGILRRFHYIDVPGFKEFFKNRTFQEYLGISRGNTQDVEHARQPRPERIRKKIIDVVTDCAFAYPAISEANFYANKSQKIFFYQAEYGTRIPNYFTIPPYLENGYHETEKFMAFGFLVNSGEPSSPDSRLSSKVMRMWSNFAKTGDPNNPIALGLSENIQWPEYDEETQQYLSIKPNMTINRELRPGKMSFWGEVESRYRLMQTQQSSDSSFKNESSFSADNDTYNGTIKY